MNDFLKSNGFNLANGITLLVIIASVALVFGTVTADVRHLKEDMITTESKEVAETKQQSLSKEISILREGIREDMKDIRKDISRLESKIDEIILRLP